VKSDNSQDKADPATRGRSLCSKIQIAMACAGLIALALGVALMALQGSHVTSISPVFLILLGAVLFLSSYGLNIVDELRKQEQDDEDTADPL